MSILTHYAYDTVRSTTVHSIVHTVNPHNISLAHNIIQYRVQCTVVYTVCTASCRVLYCTYDKQRIKRANKFCLTTSWNENIYYSMSIILRCILFFCFVAIYFSSVIADSESSGTCSCTQVNVIYLFISLCCIWHDTI